MTHIKFDYSKLLGQFVEQEEIDFMQTQVNVADEYLRKGTGPVLISWLVRPSETTTKKNLLVSKSCC